MRSTTTTWAWLERTRATRTAPARRLRRRCSSRRRFKTQPTRSGCLRRSGADLIVRSRRRIASVAGARPNFMKIAPLVGAFSRRPEQFESLLVHTGQHYDEKLSQIFFDELGIPRPDINLNVGSGSHAQQTAAV